MNSRAVRTTLLVGCLALFAGCQVMVNPFRDELADEPPVTTPSVEAARERGGQPEQAHRPYEPVIRYAEDGTVTHLPLYFEDPFEIPPPDNQRFAWTGEDYLYALYGPGRYLVNMIFFPLSVIDTPPWQVMESDGVATPRGLFREDFDPAKQGRSAPEADQRQGSAQDRPS